MSACPNGEIANNRVERTQTGLLSVISSLIGSQLDLEDAAQWFDQEDVADITAATERMRLAALDLRAAEMRLDSVTARRQQQLATARERAAAACES
jgi:hypothetical protein